jgi:hypothetical protein
VIKCAVFPHELHEKLSIGGLSQFEDNVHDNPLARPVKRET